MVVSSISMGIARVVVTQEKVRCSSSNGSRGQQQEQQQQQLLWVTSCSGLVQRIRAAFLRMHVNLAIVGCYGMLSVRWM
jgi:hypothetical protein